MSIDPGGSHIPERWLGRRLRDAREDAGLTQTEIANLLGIGRRTVIRYESATDVAETRRPVLIAWALATGVPRTWLETGQAPRGEGPDGGTSVVAGPGFEPGTSGLPGG
ncbi:helix-turn-helix transcriptional regulator, partial [uncultured Microbacterium sp.]|uniref:helix-turn-helix domain-containing protein n=1 Tax=uncultured Microbacterium sp. TaxID=191216 RepID=UPI00341D96F1